MAKDYLCVTSRVFSILYILKKNLIFTAFTLKAVCHLELFAEHIESPAFACLL